MREPHRDARRAAPRGATDADDLAHPLREHPPRCQALHRTHGRPDARIEFLDTEVIEEGELSPDHVEDADHGKRRRVGFPRSRIDGRRARRPITPAEDVRADDEELVRVQRAPGTDELFPPARRGVLARRRGVRRRRESRVQQDHVIPRGRERPPRLVRDVKLGQRRGGVVRQRERGAHVAVRLVGGRRRTRVRRFRPGGRGVAGSGCGCALFELREDAAFARGVLGHAGEGGQRTGRCGCGGLEGCWVEPPCAGRRWAGLSADCADRGCADGA